MSAKFCNFLKEACFSSALDAFWEEFLAWSNLQGLIAAIKRQADYWIQQNMIHVSLDLAVMMCKAMCCQRSTQVL